jgi:hypothetical protein
LFDTSIQKCKHEYQKKLTQTKKSIYGSQIGDKKNMNDVDPSSNGKYLFFLVVAQLVEKSLH